MSKQDFLEGRLCGLVRPPEADPFGGGTGRPRAPLERRYGTFSRTIGLPQGVSEDAISAAYTNGVLEISVPKPEQQKPKRIEEAVQGAHPTIEATNS